jgi:hypothetical protein
VACQLSSHVACLMPCVDDESAVCGARAGTSLKCSDETVAMEMLSDAGVGLDEDGRCEHEERQHTRRAGHVHVSELSLGRAA